jgi:hypothetical protein
VWSACLKQHNSTNITVTCDSPESNNGKAAADPKFYNSSQIEREKEKNASGSTGKTDDKKDDNAAPAFRFGLTGTLAVVASAALALLTL